MSEWISVKDRLPNNSGDYLVWPDGKYHGHEVRFTVYEFKGDYDTIPCNSFYYASPDDCSGSCNLHVIEPTHWMPLPDPPAKVGG